MSSIDEFLEFCTQILNADIGHHSKRIVNKVKSMKKLDDKSNLQDFEEFINLMEKDVSVVSGKNNAVNICSALRSKAIELNYSKQAMEIYNALRVETSELSISDFLKKINVVGACTFRPKSIGVADKHKSPNFSISKKIEQFLKKHVLPTESDINRFATKLAYQFCEDIKLVKEDIIAKVQTRVKDSLRIEAIREETKDFLTAYPQPTQPDIDDFIRHVHLSKRNLKEDELRHQIVDEIFHHKFDSRDSEVPNELAAEDSTELAEFLDIIKTYDNKKDIIKEMQRRGIIYIIEDESGISNKLLDEYIDIYIS